jgi:hypothetical protein
MVDGLGVTVGDWLRIEAEQSMGSGTSLLRPY